VSPLWRDQLRIAVCPDRLVIAGYRRGLRPRLERAEIVPVPPPGEGPSWRAAVDALPAALAASAAARPEVTVILSNHFVRYDLLSWNAALKTDAEWMALARHRVASVHGHPAEHWALSVSITTPRGPRLVSACDRGLLDALEARIKGAGATLVAVQPHLMTVFNRIRPPVGTRSCWLVIDEPGRATVALIQHGAWHAIRSRGIDDREPASLAEMLEREAAILGLERPCTQVFVHGAEPGGAGHHGRYDVRDVTLAAGAAVRDRQLAMAIG
jgi:hypothetical protein